MNHFENGRQKALQLINTKYAILNGSRQDQKYSIGDIVELKGHPFDGRNYSIYRVKDFRGSRGYELEGLAFGGKGSRGGMIHDDSEISGKVDRGAIPKSHLDNLGW